MKVAIVGSSKLTENEERDVRQYFGIMLNKMLVEYDDLTVISGGAKGVDTIAEEVAKQLNIKTRIFRPEVQQWDDVDVRKGFKTRNLEIAENCDILYCFPSTLRNMECYHCKSDDHQVSGGCWTALKTKEKGKEVRVIKPINRS